MASIRIAALGMAAFLSVASSACTNSRPSASENRPSVMVDNCVLCHGTAGRVGNLPGTDPFLPAAPPVAPSGQAADVIGAHQVHLNPPIVGPLRSPIACDECHVIPTNLTHATNPPANPVQFGVLARARGAAPTFDPLTLGCAAVYCHGNFDFNGVRRRRRLRRLP
jgi:hypothetical protein